ncbi:MAG: LysR family transcriptional regulator [Rudaea sp.]|nr:MULTISPECIES: LysR family transcriptional regulator [unclassified Rudaea]MBN8885237.1 LysR family transcriptional regulator [Rudaea sp.]
MPRLEVNRAGEMEAFVRAVSRRNFSAAARELRMTPSAISKLVARLEARLGVRLLQRSTRKLELTAEGAAFFERSQRALAELDEAERSVAAGAAPRGRVRVNCSVVFGQCLLMPALPKFLARYPEVTLDVDLTDRVVDLVDERADVAMRHGRLPSSRLVARHLGDSRKAIVAAPAYLRRHGTPTIVKELEKHVRLGFNYAHSTETWPLRERRGGTASLPINGPARVSNGEALRALVLAGLGLARLSTFHVQRDLDAGRLVAVMEAFNPGDIEPLNAVYLGRGGHLPARVRVFLDWLAEEFKIS